MSNFDIKSLFVPAISLNVKQDSSGPSLFITSSEITAYSMKNPIDMEIVKSAMIEVFSNFDNQLEKVFNKLGIKKSI